MKGIIKGFIDVSTSVRIEKAAAAPRVLQVVSREEKEDTVPVSMTVQAKGLARSR